MRLNQSNLYVFTSPYMSFNQHRRHPGGYGMSEDIERISAKVVLLLSCVPRGEIYDCEVITGAFFRGMFHEHIYRMSNFSLPRGEITAKEKTYTNRQLSNMSDAERMAIQHQLVVTKGLHNQIEVGDTLTQVMSLSPQAKRLLKEQFSAEEYYLDEPVGEEPDE
jgi:hypothetical protein